MSSDSSPHTRIGLPKVLGYLTNLSHATAPFITTFLLIHLTAPVAANLGGADLSSSVMLLGREYYQTVLSEPLLVLGPIAVHSLSGLARRCLLTYRRRKSSSSSSSESKFSLIPLTPLTLSAYPLLIIYGLHVNTHRDIPSIPTPPISALSPAELDFGFVQYALHHWPVRSIIGYGLLVAFAAVHAVAGTKVLMRRFGVRSRKTDVEASPSDEEKSQRLAPRRLTTTQATLALAFGLTLPVLSGLIVLYREPLYMFEHMASRVRAVFEHSLVYRY